MTGAWFTVLFGLGAAVVLLLTVFRSFKKNDRKKTVLPITVVCVVVLLLCTGYNLPRDRALPQTDAYILEDDGRILWEGELPKEVTVRRYRFGDVPEPRSSFPTEGTIRVSYGGEDAMELILFPEGDLQSFLNYGDGSRWYLTEESAVYCRDLFGG